MKKTKVTVEEARELVVRRITMASFMYDYPEYRTILARTRERLGKLDRERLEAEFSKYLCDVVIG